MSDYIEKRWNKEVMEKRLENLKKIIHHYFVDNEIRMAKNQTENELDALYIAYYNLKDRYCKIKRSSFGKPKKVGYVPKKKKIGYYSPYWDDDDDWSWTINGLYGTYSIGPSASNSATNSNYSTTTTTNAYTTYWNTL